MLTADGRRLPSLGPEVCRWIESSVRLGRGDYLGQPFRLTSFQRRWVYRLKEYYPDSKGGFGEYRYKRALFGTGKGNGKTPFEAAIAAEGLAGPTAPVAPLVLVAAASLGQADLVFGDLKLGTADPNVGSPLAQFLTPLELSVQLKDGVGEAKRVAAVVGTNDGPRATLLVGDEMHEWLGRLRDAFDVLDGSIGKRANAQSVLVSTAGSDLETLLGSQYSRGKQIASGEIIDDATLFEWYEIPGTVEIPERLLTEADLEQWRKAILWANPALLEGGYLREDYIRSRFDGAQVIERYKWLRYHGNRWTYATSRWLPDGRWDDCERPVALREHSPVVLAFSGTYDRDSAGLVACSRDGTIAVLGVWEPKGPDDKDYEVPTDEVQAAVRRSMQDYRVERFVCNPNGWFGEVQGWTTAYGERTVAVFDWTHQTRRKHDACSKFYTAVLNRGVGHDGNATLARHLDSATEKETAEGAWITKRDRNGPPIDLAVASVMALDQATAVLTRSSRGNFAGVTV